MGIDRLGKYICNILTIFVHSFYWDTYYRHFRDIPSAQTPLPAAPRPPTTGSWVRGAPHGPGNESARGPGFTAHDRGRAGSLYAIFFPLPFACSSF